MTSEKCNFLFLEQVANKRKKIISKRFILEMNVSMVKVCNHEEELIVSRCVKTTDKREAISIHCSIH